MVFSSIVQSFAIKSVMGYEIDRSLWWNRPIWDYANRSESRIRAAIARDLAYPGVQSVSVSHRSDGVSIF